MVTKKSNKCVIISEAYLNIPDFVRREYFVLLVFLKIDFCKKKKFLQELHILWESLKTPVLKILQRFYVLIIHPLYGLRILYSDEDNTRRKKNGKENSHE